MPGLQFDAVAFGVGDIAPRHLPRARRGRHHIAGNRAARCHNRSSHRGPMWS